MKIVLTKESLNKLVVATETAIERFTEGDWRRLGAFTHQLDLINNHPRLLRSLNFGDDDYPGLAHEIMNHLVDLDVGNFGIILDFVNRMYGDAGQGVFAATNISTAPSKGHAISFTPSVFEVPDTGVERDLIAVMSPFAPEFENVFGAISVAAASVGYRVLRAKDIWQHTAVIQDVFSLIFRAHIVVCDFTGKNPNVFYEAGIAHTLGKHVVPITQFPDDIPFDLRHHRYQTYHNNGEGRGDLSKALADRFNTLR
jgi:hypothetical protein